MEGTDQNVGVENVYEYEPREALRLHAGGCVGLISSGESEHESAFLDASESGDDVFFLTAQQLAPQDIDTNFDVYDARVCEPGSRCAPPPAKHAKTCGESEECQGSQSSYEAGPAPRRNRHLGLLRPRQPRAAQARSPSRKEDRARTGEEADARAEARRKR